MATPLMTILHNIGGGFRDEDGGGGEAGSSTGLLGGLPAKSGRLRLGGTARRAPSTSPGLDSSMEFDRRTEGGMSAAGLRPRASNTAAGAGGRGLSHRVSMAAGSRRASYLEPLMHYSEAQVEGALPPVRVQDRQDRPDKHDGS